MASSGGRVGTLADANWLKPVGVLGEEMDQYLGLVPEWVWRGIGRVYVRMFDTALANWVGGPAGMCVHAETCGLQLALEHNDDLYCCDHFVEPDYLLGDITGHTRATARRVRAATKFGQDKRDTLTPYCLDCDVRFACNGGCPKDRFATSPYRETGQHYLCPSYKNFFHHVERPMRIMADLLATNRAPAELTTARTKDDAHRGRNEPCTCGSNGSTVTAAAPEPLPGIGHRRGAFSVVGRARLPASRWRRAACVRGSTGT